MVHTMLLASNCIPVRGPQIQNLFSLGQQGLHCDVVFGSPSADCSGTGICKITGTNGFFIHDQKKECQRTQAVLFQRADKKGLTLIFFRSLLCSKLFRHHFWKGVLKMDEPCMLPGEIRDQLETPFSKMLPGWYLVTEASGYFKVDIDCAE